MLQYYSAIVHKDPGSDYGVSFPDFPGCVSAGKTQSEALVMAREALSLHIEGMMADGEAIPEPTAVDGVADTVQAESGFHAITLVEAALPGPSVRINVTFEESTLDDIDTAAASLGLNRSAFLAFAARDKMDLLFRRRLQAAQEDDAEVA